MAIEDISITETPTTASPQIGIRLYDGKTYSPCLMWSTYNGIDWQKQFVIDLSWRGVPKGTVGTGDTGNTPWSAWASKTIPASQCHPYQVSDSDKWWWWVDLSVATDLESSMTTNGVWSYGNRIYDQVQFRWRMRSDYEPLHIDAMGRDHSETVTADSWIGAFPEYTITDAYRQGDSFVLTYTSPGWTRNDDRYEVLTLTANGRNILNPGYWDTVQSRLVEKIGWIALPTRSLTTIPEVGDVINVHLRFNASYRPMGMEFEDASATITYDDQTTGNTPTFDVTVNGDSISVGVGDSGDRDSPLSSIIVKVDNGTFEWDEVHVDTLEGAMANAFFNFPPTNRTVRIQAQGVTGTGGVSNVVTHEVFIPANGRILIDPIDSAGERAGDQCVIYLNPEWSTSRSREKNVVQLAGRRRPSAFFGGGGSTSVKVSGRVPREFDMNKADWDAESPWYNLGDAAMCVIRTPDGQRFVVALDSVDVDESYGQKLMSVSLTGQEVS